MRQTNWPLLVLLLCLLFVFCLARPISGQESSATSILELSQPLNLSISNPWESFVQAWQSLKDELTQSDLDLDVLLIQLQSLQTEAQELRRLYLESMKQLDSLDKVNKDILVQREIAIASRDKWRLTAFIAPLVAISCGLVIGIFIH